MSTPTAEGYAKKIQALLAKAERTDNPHEAQSFSDAAQRLMLKWGIDEAMARKAAGDQAPQEEVVSTSKAFTGIYHYGLWKVAKAVCEGLGNLRPFITKRPKATYITVVGFENDVKRAMILIDSLTAQSLGAVAQWWKTAPERGMLTSMDAFKARRQFVISFGSGVYDRLASARTEEVAAVAGSELVLVDRGAKVDAHIEATMGEASTSVSRYHGVSVGKAEGRAAGHRAAGSVSNTAAVTR